jgi:hypothetical protein
MDMRKLMIAFLAACCPMVLIPWNSCMANMAAILILMMPVRTPLDMMAVVVLSVFGGLLLLPYVSAPHRVQLLGMGML